MILELKKSFVKKMAKAINRLINGYHVALDTFIDEIYYINSIVFCAPSATIVEGDSSTLCAITTTTTTLPPTTTTTTTVAPTTTTTTATPPSCNFNGGTITLIP